MLPNSLFNSIYIYISIILVCAHFYQNQRPVVTSLAMKRHSSRNITLFVGSVMMLLGPIATVAQYESAVGDPGMRRDGLRVAFEAWNFCNEVGIEAPGMGSPRAADCFDLSGRHRQRHRKSARFHKSESFSLSRSCVSLRNFGLTCFMCRAFCLQMLEQGRSMTNGLSSADSEQFFLFNLFNLFLSVSETKQNHSVNLFCKCR